LYMFSQSKNPTTGLKKLYKDTMAARNLFSNNMNVTESDTMCTQEILYILVLVLKYLTAL
jgi:hypothetical protein